LHKKLAVIVLNNGVKALKFRCFKVDCFAWHCFCTWNVQMYMM